MELLCCRCLAAERTYPWKEASNEIDWRNVLGRAPDFGIWDQYYKTDFAVIELL